MGDTVAPVGALHHMATLALPHPIDVNDCWRPSSTIRVCLHGLWGQVEVMDGVVDRWLILRVGGLHPQTVLFAREQAGTWSAKFRLCRAGRYTLVVRAMMMQPWQEWFHSWTEQPNQRPCAGSWEERKLLQHEFMYAGHTAGRNDCTAGLWSWTVDVDAANNHARTLLEDITPAVHPNRSSLGTMYRALHFTDPLMSHHASSPLSQQRDEQARPNMHICVVGDSQMRTLADGLTQQLLAANGLVGGEACRPSGAKGACGKAMQGSSVCTRKLMCVGESGNVTVRYYRSDFGNGLSAPWPHKTDPPFADHLTGSCTVALFNSGQWWAAHKIKPTRPRAGVASNNRSRWDAFAARSPSEYGDDMAGVIMRIAALEANSPLRVAWVATNPYPINAGGKSFEWSRAKPYDMSRCPPTERRFPHVMDGYNIEARRLASAHGVAYIDTWEVALPLFDVSEDGAHFTWADSPVGRAQASRVLAWVMCAQSEKRHGCRPARAARTFASDRRNPAQWTVL